MNEGIRRKTEVNSPASGQSLPELLALHRGKPAPMRNQETVEFFVATCDAFLSGQKQFVDVLFFGKGSSTCLWTLGFFSYPVPDGWVQSRCWALRASSIRQRYNECHERTAPARQDHEHTPCPEAGA
jgi:hypothetical protein